MKKLIYFIGGSLCTLGMLAYGMNMYERGKESVQKEAEGNSDKEKSE